MTFTQQDYEAWLKRLRDPNTKQHRGQMIKFVGPRDPNTKQHHGQMIKFVGPQDRSSWDRVLVYEYDCRCALGHAFPELTNGLDIQKRAKSSIFFAQFIGITHTSLAIHVMMHNDNYNRTLPQIADWVEKNARTPDQLATA